MDNKKRPLFEQVAEKLIEQLENGTSPFQMPWKDDIREYFPFNPTTNKPYRGMNSLWLMMQGYTDPRWLTFKQAQAKGWTVERGTKGTLINYVKTHELVKAKDADQKPILDENGKQKVIRVELERPIITSAYVFNAEKIKGITPLSELIPTEQQWQDLDRVEKLIRKTKASIQHGGNQAYYNPSADKITMPKKAQFADTARYYSTLLHELAHWTGHPSRLDRPMITSFGTEEYAKEELRAEIASLMLGGDLKIGRDFGDHASYVKSWISVLKNDPFELYKASSDAQKIRDFILSFEQKRSIKKTQEKPESLLLHDVIDYNGQQYKVVGLLANRKLQLSNLDSGRTFKLEPDDRLYSSLIEAKKKLTNGQNHNRENNHQERNGINAVKAEDEIIYKSFKR